MLERLRSVISALEVRAERAFGARRTARLDQLDDRLVLGEHLRKVPGRPRRAEAHHADEAAELGKEPLDDRETRRRSDVEVELLVELDEAVLVAGVDGTPLTNEQQAEVVDLLDRHLLTRTADRERLERDPD